MYKIFSLSALLFLLSFFPVQAEQKIHHFEAGDGCFLLDDKPFVIKAAELHYARIPFEYWEHRILMCKALGMNSICLYVFWNYHEEEEGVYRFDGERDLAQFLKLCQKHDMWVILRPGPYVCAEWEMGGLPWWLLSKDNMKLRSQHPEFMSAVGRFERRLAQELQPFMLKNGGNILMVQVENEFGAYGTDKAYMSAMRDTLRAAGWDETLLFQCDWSRNFQNNALDDLIWTMNFGVNANPLDQFVKLHEMRPEAPRMCSEYWSGWFDGWGRKHETRSADALVKGIRTMLENQISFSLYMTHGGTSFAHWVGTNSRFSPTCTSYDYDAPINEQGAATEKYHQLRAVLQEYSQEALMDIPAPLPIIHIPTIHFDQYASLEANVSAVEHQLLPLPFEKMNFAYGSAMYQHVFAEDIPQGDLQIKEGHDFARIFLNNRLIGELYRGENENFSITMPAVQKGDSLCILIEAFGRVNYSHRIHDYKGIGGEVAWQYRDNKDSLQRQALQHWTIRYIDARTLPQQWETVSERQPGYYKAQFRLKKTGDTFLDLSTWGKGYVWVNGHCLGRFWQVGPQQTLYCPGVWLKKGKNEIVVMDILEPETLQVEGLEKPIIDRLRKEMMPSKKTFGNESAPGAQ